MLKWPYHSSLTRERRNTTRTVGGVGERGRDLLNWKFRDDFARLRVYAWTTKGEFERNFKYYWSRPHFPTPVVTRNVADFRHASARIFNPFEE